MFLRNYSVSPCGYNMLPCDLTRFLLRSEWKFLSFMLVKITNVGNIQKGKGHPCTGTEALYRPYGLQGEQRYSSTLSLPRHYYGVRGQRHTPAALYPWERTGTHCTGGWVGPRVGLDRCGKSRPHRDSIPGPPSPQSVTIPTELPGPQEIYSLSKTTSAKAVSLLHNFYSFRRKERKTYYT